MPFTQPWLEVDFGSAYAGLGTVGYRLYQADGSDSVARTTTGVVDVSGNGAYGVASVSVPDNAAGVEWDTGGGSPVYAVEDLEPYRDRDELVTDVNAVLADTDAIDARLPTDPADQSLVEAAITTAESNIRGPDGDDLKDISDQIDALPTAAGIATQVWSEPLPGTFGSGEAGQIVGDNIDTTVSSRAVPGDEMALVDDAITSAKHDESTSYPLAQADTGASAVARTGADGDTLETLSDQIDATALEANVEGHVTSALNAYDPPTKAELDTAESNIRGADSDDLKTISDQIDALPTAGGIADQVWDEPKAGHVAVGSFGEEVQSHATPAEVNAECDTALTDYDPPTRAEATADKEEIIAEVDANEAKIDALPTAADNADAVWDELIAGHLGGDKAGQHLEDADATADPAAVADAVWDEATSGHVAAGSFGKLAQDTFTALGITNSLLHDNAVLDQQTYDGDDNLESARLRSYDTRANAEAAGATGLLYTFLITAEYTNGLLTSYTLVRVGS